MWPKRSFLAYVHAFMVTQDAPVRMGRRRCSKCHFELVLGHKARVRECVSVADLQERVDQICDQIDILKRRRQELGLPPLDCEGSNGGAGGAGAERFDRGASRRILQSRDR